MLQTRIPSNVAHRVTIPWGLIIPKLRLVKKDTAMLMQHFQATIPAGQNKPTVLTEGTLLHLWQLHTCLFKPPARSCPQSNPLCSDTDAHISTNTLRYWLEGTDRNRGCRTELPSAAVQGYANTENATAVLVPLWVSSGGVLMLPHYENQKNLGKVTQKTEWKGRSKQHTPPTSPFQTTGQFR